MRKNHSSPIIGTALLFACLLATVSGCSALRRKPLQPQTAFGAIPKAVTTPQSAADADPSGLAAVAAFLERTAEFQLPGDPDLFSSPSTKPVAELSAKATKAVPALTGPFRPNAEGGRANRAVANAQVVLEEPVVRAPQLALPVVQSVSVRADPSLGVPASAPAKSRTTNTPLKVGGGDAAMTLDSLVALLEARVVEVKDFDAEWQLRVTQLALRRDTEAASVSSHLAPETRRILKGLVRAVAAVRAVARDPLLAGEKALERVEELRRILADRADPVISAVSLCHRVITFGVYEPMADTDFIAGRATQAIVYTEIHNFRSQETDDGQFRTRLATRLEVLTAEGESVWEHEEPEIDDVCRRRRTDFFIAQRVTLPPTLPAGKYVLKVLVEDKLSGRADEATHPFTIRSALLTAGGG